MNVQEQTFKAGNAEAKEKQKEIEQAAVAENNEGGD